MATDSADARLGETELHVPTAGPEGADECVVTACPVDAGSEVVAGQVIVRMHSGDVDMGVKAPGPGRLALLHARPGATMRVGDPLAVIVAPGGSGAEATDEAEVGPTESLHGGLAEVLGRRASLGVAAVVAAFGLVWPVATLLLSLLVAVLAAAARDVERRAGGGLTEIVVLPLRLLRGVAARARAKGFGGFVLSVVRFARWVALAVLATAAVGCLAWLASEGTQGVVSATRLAVYGYGVTALAVIASFSMVRRALSSGTTPRHLERAVGWFPEGWLALAALAGACWIIACAALLPSRDWGPAGSFRAAADALPASIRDGIHDIRASVVSGEARRVVQCLADRERALWRQPRVHVLREGSLLVGVRPSRVRRPSRYNVATLALALQNQLAPTGVHVSILPRRGAQSLEFSTVPAKRPVTDPWRVLDLIEDKGPGMPDRSRDVITDHDVGVALRCSAAAL